MESNHTTEELIFELALSRLDGVGSVQYKNLLNHFGSAREVLKTPTARLMKIPGVGSSIAKGLSRKEEAIREAEQIIRESEKKEIKILHLKSPEYPEKLKDVFDSPPIIYLRGNGNFRNRKTLAIVGTRDATDYGKGVVNELLRELKDIQIISGLAYGIDIAAHKAALKYGHSTIAVLAHGLETVYPSAHKKTALEMLENGLLISEQPVGTKLHPQFFISRNRIIAALSEVTLVVESGKKGGSMVTAEYANNYHREVFSVPGEISKKQSEGTNRLIFDHKAHIFTDTTALVDWMEWNSDAKPEKKQAIPDLNTFTEEEAVVLRLLIERGEMQIDDLGWYSEIQLNRLSSILLQLEFTDVIKQTPGKRFSIKR